MCSIFGMYLNRDYYGRDKKIDFQATSTSTLSLFVQYVPYLLEASDREKYPTVRSPRGLLSPVGTRPAPWLPLGQERTKYLHVLGQAEERIARSEAVSSIL